MSKSDCAVQKIPPPKCLIKLWCDTSWIITLPQHTRGEVKLNTESLSSSRQKLTCPCSSFVERKEVGVSNEWSLEQNYIWGIL